MTNTRLALWITLAVFLILALIASLANFGRRGRRVPHDGGYAGDAGLSGGHWFAGSGDSCHVGLGGDGGCSDGGGGGGD